MRRVFLAKNPSATKQYSRAVLGELKKITPHSVAGVIALSGDLGAGKTTLAQGIAATLGIRGKVQSPTFVFMKTYGIKKQRRFPWKRLVHIDAYRTRALRDAAPLFLPRSFADPKNLVVIEWPERIRRALPRHTLWVALQHKGKNHRHITVGRGKN